MARWDNLWRDEAYVARNWLDPDPHIVRLTPIMQGRRVQRVLDLGCGVGRHLLYLARQGFEGHGLDISPYPDAFFDWALSVQVIHHTTAATLRQVIHHVHHKLKRGASFSCHSHPSRTPALTMDRRSNLVRFSEKRMVNRCCITTSRQRKSTP